MKENAPLLVLLGIMVLVVLAILVPDYFKCHPIHFVKSTAERKLEALEAADMRRFFRGPVRSILIDYNSLSVVIDYNSLSIVDKKNLVYKPKVVGDIVGSWASSYRYRNKGYVEGSSCILFTVADLSGRKIESCESRDSVTRLLEDACYLSI